MENSQTGNYSIVEKFNVIEIKFNVIDTNNTRPIEKSKEQPLTHNKPIKLSSMSGK